MELWDILDINGNKTGRFIERGKPLGKDEYHLIVDVWIRDSEDKYLISKRTPTKYPDPNLWEPTCGCAVKGDDSLKAALREVKEELGLELSPYNGKMLKRIILPGSTDIVDIWLFVQDVDINSVVFQPGETDGCIWATKEDIIQMMKEGTFLPGRRLPYISELL